MVDQYASAPSRATLQSIRERLEDLRPPPALRARGMDYIGHLGQLIESLQKLAMEETAIGEHVFDLFERYEAQLLRLMAVSKLDS